MRAKEFVVEYKKYPTQDYEGIKISMVEKDGRLFVRAIDDWGVNELGSVEFVIGDSKELDPQDLQVDDRYQGQGIARTMYDYVKSKGYKIQRSWDQTDAGAGFWNKHRGEDVRVWEDKQQGVTAYHGNQGGIHKELITPMWWTEDRDTAVYYATQYGGDGYVYTATLSCKNPYVITDKDETNTMVEKYKALAQQGYDSIYDPRGNDWIPFYNKDIHITDKEYLDGEEQGVTEGYNTITEYRDRMYQYIKSIVPTWPDYIVKDWLYANFAKGETYNKEKGWSFKTMGKDIPKILNDMGLSVNTTWQLVPNVKFTMDMWEPKTLKRLQARAGGSATSTDPMVHIPARDAERHATQAALAQQQGGVRKEPVILIKTAKGYELLEGWHRTIQHFAQYPNGYTGPAYVAVAQGQQDVAEASDHMLSEEQPEVRPHRVTDKELVQLLGKGKTNAMLRHPWFQRYSSYEKAYRYARDRWGFVTVDMFPYMTSVNKTADGSIRPTIYVSFVFSYTGPKVVQAHQFRRDQEPDEFEKRNPVTGGWKHGSTWKVDKTDEMTEGRGSGYKEIEFVCANPEFPDATDHALQKQMYVGLQRIPGVIPLFQDQSDYSEGQYSLTAIYKDPPVRGQILKLAKQLGVSVDLEQSVTDDYVDRAIRGEHEGQQGVAEGTKLVADGSIINVYYNGTHIGNIFTSTTKDTPYKAYSKHWDMSRLFKSKKAATDWLAQTHQTAIKEEAQEQGMAEGSVEEGLKGALAGAALAELGALKIKIFHELKQMPLTVFGSTVTKNFQDANDFDVFLDLDQNPTHKKFVRHLLNLAREYYGWIDAFVLKDAVLYVRNDDATGWTRAKNSLAILQQIRAHGKSIDDIKEQGVTEDDNQSTPIRIDSRDRALAWIQKVYAAYPQTWQNNHVMPLGGSGDEQQFAMFELVPSMSQRGAVEIKWFQAYPLRQGVGTRAMQELQRLAQEDGISLTLFPWDKGQVSQSKLMKFYKSAGFQPTVKGSKSLAWSPEPVAEDAIQEDAVMGKIEQSGKIVRILKKQHTVPFSDEKDWLLIDTDPAKGNRGLGLKWIPAHTRFEWVRPYRDTVEENFADGRGPGRPGDSQRHGIPKGATMAQLEKAAKAPGRKGQLARWQLNMRRGKKNESQ